jgi:hypothetical protein
MRNYNKRALIFVNGAILFDFILFLLFFSLAVVWVSA